MDKITVNIAQLEERIAVLERQMEKTNEEERIAIRQQISAVDQRIAALTLGVVRTPESVLWSAAWWDMQKANLAVGIPMVLAGSLTCSRVAMAHGVTGVKLRVWTTAGGFTRYCAATPLMMVPRRRHPASG